MPVSTHQVDGYKTVCTGFAAECFDRHHDQRNQSAHNVQGVQPNDHIKKGVRYTRRERNTRFREVEKTYNL